MRKKDPEFSENIDRTAENEKTSQAADEISRSDNNADNSQFTNVKNASASGLGTMGRSDEKLSDQSGNSNSDTY